VKQNTWSEYISSLTVLEKLVVILAVVEAFGQRGDPFRRIDGEPVHDALAVAIGPVRGDACLGHLVHLAGADLHLDPLAVAARDGGVDRAVAVRLGLADIVLEPPRHGAPALMDHTEDTVAVGLGVADHPEAVDVGESREGQFLLAHLAPDRIGLLGAAVDIGLDAVLLQLGADVGGDLVDHVAGLALQRDEAADDRRARLGVEHPEGEVLQLLAHPLHAHAPGQRRIDVHRLARLLHLLGCAST
jgi:hypothetical protein